jgi:hypothetical protein
MTRRRPDPWELQYQAPPLWVLLLAGIACAGLVCGLALALVPA